MSPIFAQYNTLSITLQAIHQSNLGLIESYFLLKIRQVLFLFLEKIDLLKELIFTDTALKVENHQLKEDLMRLQQELKDKNSICSLLEEEYAKSQEKTKSIHVTIHEIKTPLTSIIGFSELLLRDKASYNETQQDVLQRIVNAGHKQLEIIDQMLTRMSKKNELVRHTVKVEEVADELQANIQVLAEKKGLNFYVSVGSDVPESIQTDSNKLDSILTNLLSNAVKYTDEGSIHFNILSHSGNRVAFEIKDSGRGIPYDEQKHIFTFYRRGSNIQQEEGLGIGLALCQEMTNVLGGDISVYSEGQGKGSTFILTLPINPEFTVN
ncbi:HAMP domain-containing sensor histidine kinase [Deltaproteobacteria bacterium TL4]